METLVAVEGRRWAIEDSFETTKTELGLDHNESRSWHGWHRHVSLVMLAFDACNHPPSRQSTLCFANLDPPDSEPEKPLIRWSVQEIRRIATRLAQRHPASPHHRLVALAARSPGCRPALSSETESDTEKATVMLGSVSP